MNSFIFFFNDTATTEIYTLSLHDALPIFVQDVPHAVGVGRELRAAGMDAGQALQQMVGQARLAVQAPDARGPAAGGGPALALRRGEGPVQVADRADLGVAGVGATLPSRTRAPPAQ